MENAKRYNKIYYIKYKLMWQIAMNMIGGFQNIINECLNYFYLFF